MSFIKRNLVFCIFAAIAVLIFLGGCYLAFDASGQADAASKTLAETEQQYRSLADSDPAPSSENVERSEENVEALAKQLASIREDLQSGSRISTSTDGIEVIAGVQQYISTMQRKASAHTNDRGEPDEIVTPDDFAFGFERYRERATPPDDPAKIAQLDKQRQILAYLMNQLVAADPEGIEAVERELVEVPRADSDDRRDRERSGFTINPAVSARVPGAIDTLAFEITFTGRTNSLRALLNQLARFEMPIVVRSIEVDRPAGGGATTAPAAGGNDLDALFGGDGDGEDAGAEEPVRADPVVEDIVSRFTLVLEYIEIVLPDEDDSSEAADSNGEDLS